MAEKKVSMDTVKAKHLTNYTYRKGFKRTYQMKLMKMIFECVFLDKIEEEYLKEYANYHNPNADIVNVNKTIFDVYNKVVFQAFKINCFDAYKFKNLLLNYEDWVADEKYTYIFDTNPAPKDSDERVIKPILDQYKIHRLDQELKIINLKTVESCINAITDIRNESLKYEEEEEFEKIFNPLIEIVQDMIYIKICRARLAAHQGRLQEVRFHNIGSD
jgi:hypothetical protein